MNGDTAGLESADTSRQGDPRDSVEACSALLAQTAEVLEWLGEYKAAREVLDSKGRVESWWPSREIGEGQRSGKAVHGQNPEDAQIANDLSYDPNRG